MAQRSQQSLELTSTTLTFAGTYIVIFVQVLGSSGISVLSEKKVESWKDERSVCFGGTMRDDTSILIYDTNTGNLCKVCQIGFSQKSLRKQEHKQKQVVPKNSEEKLFTYINIKIISPGLK